MYIMKMLSIIFNLFQMEERWYSREQNIQIVVALLKLHNIKRIIVSPGGTNVSFVASLQCDSFFKIYSCIDERSAAYMACGLAAETNDVVVLSCTGATSSRNYMPALTEAFYRRLPILAITSHCGEDSLNHLRPQQIDRKQGPSDVFIGRYQANFIKDYRDFRACEIEVNRAILALTERQGGPVHLNLYTNFTPHFDCESLPTVRVIRRVKLHDEMPSIKKYKRIAVFIGSHKCFSKDEVNSLETFCSINNAVVICDHTSSYHGKYSVNVALPFVQADYDSPLKNLDLLVHIGEISGDYYSSRVLPKKVWRVNIDGAIRDTFGSLEYVFEMEETDFFNRYSDSSEDNFNVLSIYNEEYEKCLSLIPNLPFSNLWIAQQTHSHIPSNSRIHFAILNSLRAWNFFKLDRNVTGFCNVGGFGIDGALSTAIGASLGNTNNLYYLIIGDLAFFYDMNALGNRHVGHNLRILLVNNGKGTEFKNRESFAYAFGDTADPYMAAAGHYGNKSPLLVKHYAEDLGFIYLTASNKEEYLKNLPTFVNPEIGDSPILFEVFTDSKDESDALEMMFHLVKPEDKSPSFKEKIDKMKNQVKCSIKAHYNGAIDKLKL